MTGSLHDLREYSDLFRSFGPRFVYTKPANRRILWSMRVKKQYAALPWREGADGRLQVMLITSRNTGRWIVPKGWPIASLKPWEVAAREAYEEAGLIGQASDRRLGRFFYAKAMPVGSIDCRVDVFPLAVQRQLDVWPERSERHTEWFSPAEAAMKVSEGGLITLLLNLAGGPLPELCRASHRAA